MRIKNDLVCHTLETGAIASVTTTLAVALLGKGETDHTAAPLNAISHIIWGDEAADENDVSAKYTLTGVALNAVAITSWAGVHEMLFGATIDRGDVVGAALGGVLVSAIAYVTDYHIVPRRFTPGFEKRLTNQSLLAIYGVLAVSLGLGRLCFGARKRT